MSTFDWVDIFWSAGTDSFTGELVWGVTGCTAAELDHVLERLAEPYDGKVEFTMFSGSLNSTRLKSYLDSRGLSL